jgi:hypothetical protein
VHGDSGGPAYTVRPPEIGGGIAAKGVLGSGGLLMGVTCFMDFTNLRYVPQMWPGMSLQIQ